MVTAQLRRVWSWRIGSYDCRVVQDSTIWSRLSVALYLHFQFFIAKSKTSAEKLTIIQLLRDSLFIRNPKFYCIVHDSQPLATMLSQRNTFATILPYLPWSILILFFHVRANLFPLLRFKEPFFFYFSFPLFSRISGLLGFMVKHVGCLLFVHLMTLSSSGYTCMPSNDSDQWIKQWTGKRATSSSFTLGTEKM